MIAIISPAKNMKRNVPCIEGQFLLSEGEITKPEFLLKTEDLWKELKQYQPWELESLLKTNEGLAVQAFMDFQNFSLENLEGKGGSALFAYDGLVFKQIKAGDFTKEQLLFANEHVRILSAFYGTLRPFDRILPYRLEMKCKLKIEGKNLYEFWGEEYYQTVYKKDEIIVNLASEEYASCIRKYKQEWDRFLDIVFLARHQGKLKNVTTWAKMARGQMVRYLVEEKIERCEDLKEFDWNGYTFESGLSYENKYVFVL